jgi:hypothetical protein
VSDVSLSFNLPLRYLPRRHHNDFQPKGAGWEVAVGDDDAVAMTGPAKETKNVAVEEGIDSMKHWSLVLTSR